LKLKRELYARTSTPFVFFANYRVLFYKAQQQRASEEPQAAQPAA
jgi:hypothetical protein